MITVRGERGKAMSRYIDADKALALISRVLGCMPLVVLKTFEANSIDIVRCRECKWWNCEMSGCKRNPSIVAWRDDDFCSYGCREEE